MLKHYRKIIQFICNEHISHAALRTTNVCKQAEGTWCTISISDERLASNRPNGVYTQRSALDIFYGKFANNQPQPLRIPHTMEQSCP